MKVFQLKVARTILGIGVREIGSYLNVSGTTISIWESKDKDCNISTSSINITMLEQFFMIKNILFPDENTISLNEYSVNSLIKSNKQDVLTRFQLKGSRIILNLNREELAALVKISHHVIARAERLNNNEYIRPLDLGVPTKLKDIFEQKGIVFPNPLTISLSTNL